MNCAKCQKQLATWEIPQPHIIDGERRWPPAICDHCAKANPTRPAETKPAA